MDLIYYRSDIKKMNGQYNEKIKIMNKWKIIVVAISLIAICIIAYVTITRQNLFLLLILLPVIFILLIYFVIRYYRLCSVFYNIMNNFLARYLRENSDYEVNTINRAEAIHLLKEVRFAERADIVIVREGYEFKKDILQGYYVNALIIRSDEANNSNNVFSGEIYIFKDKSQVNYQMRNDHYRLINAKKVKNANYNLFLPKDGNSVEINETYFYFVRDLFPLSKSVGININHDLVAAFNTFKFKHPTPFIFSDNNIKSHLTRLESKIVIFQKLYDQYHKE